MNLQQAPIAKAEMMIRRPVAEVFAAFVDPAVTTQFWFTKSSGRLETGETVQWDWEMYGVSDQVSVKAVETNKHILIEWSADGGAAGTRTQVEWQFISRPDDTTFVSIANSGFVGDGDAVVRQAMESAGGFALVLAGAKAWLEHNINLNLVADHQPDAHKQPGA
ncbi:MAG: SRPBCC family protein [Chloroflexota bacterium]|nr:SRPBCC family protein [Chloroflexota bacterium]